jgi:hypothetical protein
MLTIGNVDKTYRDDRYRFVLAASRMQTMTMEATASSNASRVSKVGTPFATFAHSFYQH